MGLQKHWALACPLRGAGPGVLPGLYGGACRPQLADYVPAAWLQYSECGCRAGGRALAAGSRDVEGLPPAAHL